MKARRSFAHIQRPVVGGIKYRSKAEANYACYLAWLQGIGQIRSWRYEPFTFWFTPWLPPHHKGHGSIWNEPTTLGLKGVSRGVTSYKPDFLVEEHGGKGYYVEVKGYLDARSKTALARMKRYFPASRVEVVDSKAMTALKRQVGGIVPGWLP